MPRPPKDDHHRATEITEGGEPVTSPLLDELELAPPRIRGIRMPLAAWALAIGIQWIVRVALRRAYVSPLELQRSRDAAEWLSSLAASHETVLAVTHASFRSLVSRRLVERGWQCSIPRGRSRHLSAWSFVR
jgi:hypothetical protein